MNTSDHAARCAFLDRLSAMPEQSQYHLLNIETVAELRLLQPLAAGTTKAVLDGMLADFATDNGCDASGSASVATRCRINYLENQATLDALLDEFQGMGMPMGSTRWAEYCLEKLRDLREKEKTLRGILGLHDQMTKVREQCFAHVHLERRRKMTAEYQQQQRERESSQNKPPT